MADESVGPTDAVDWGRNALFLKGFEDGTAETTAEDVVLHGDDELVAYGVGSQETDIYGFNEAGVDHAGGDALLGKKLGK